MLYRELAATPLNLLCMRPIMRALIAEDTKIFTDDAAWYKRIGKEFLAHESVCHSRDEYVRGEIHTNTIENYFSILKRGLSGVYQHVSEQHLRRYIGEFDFRYNNREITDGERANVALRGIAGKRLRYTKSLL